MNEIILKRTKMYDSPMMQPPFCGRNTSNPVAILFWQQKISVGGKDSSAPHTKFSLPLFKQIPDIKPPKLLADNCPDFQEHFRPLKAQPALSDGADYKNYRHTTRLAAQLLPALKPLNVTQNPPNPKIAPTLWLPLDESRAKHDINTGPKPKIETWHKFN
jgi:hypothetical protein